ncbi:hypothetical protein SAMCCGM7_pC1714 (plasmid) [Sinorhizobium americanum CCGM7]|nr:hypothetical protein SAMCCGM7_pC1714 [Sinorhizobium americanum CCGM7]
MSTSRFSRAPDVELLKAYSRTVGDTIDRIGPAVSLIEWIGGMEGNDTASRSLPAA